MAQGFLSGLIWGGVVSVIGAGFVSVIAESPETPDVVASAPEASAAPTSGDPSTADAVTDADLVRDGEAPKGESPEADNVTAAVEAGSDTPSVPLTGGAEGLVGPVDGLATGGLAVLDDAPVLPSPQASLPSAPQAEGVLSISTDPAQPPAPVVPEIDGAFSAPDSASEVGQDPVQQEVPTVAADALEPEDPQETDEVETAEAAPEIADNAPAEPVLPITPSVPDAPQEAAIAALPSALDPSAQTGDGPTIGRRATSLVDRSADGAGASGPKDTAAANSPPIEAFAVPFENADDKPLMAIVLIDDGIDLTGGPVGLAALNSFPYPLSFAVDASLPDAARRMADYRAQGFEVMLLLDLPQRAIATDVEVTLSSVLAGNPEVVAIMEGVGTGVQGSREASDQITEALRATGHGLVLQSKGLNTAQKLALREGVPTGLIFRDFDSAGQAPTVIRRFLDQAAFRAGQEGGVIMVGRVRSDTISALLLWGLQDRAQRVALAPVSAVLRALSTGP